MSSRHVVLGTAGHIDHGKTSLVRALTGVQTDRLPEEKKRGITIELGFAQWTLSPTLSASVVDVPGHEKFVRTMVAGAAGIDAVILVVAGDDAVMPQTKEHLAVCSLLGIKTGVVALTKCDLIDGEMRQLVELDIADALAGTFLAGAPIVPVSSTTEEGLQELRDAIVKVVEALPDDAGENSAPYLGIDRVFSRAGFGTVVTGTLLGGALHEGDDVDLIPGRRTDCHRGIKIRGLEVHGEKVATAHAGRRVAVNLRGIEADDVVRGAILCATGARAPTQAVHVELTTLDGAPPIKERDELSFHLATVDEIVRAVPLDVKEIGPGSKAFVRFKSASPLFAFPGARFVVRKPGLHGQGTVGGGRVLDPHPTEGKGAFSRWQACAAGLASAVLEDNIAALLKDARNEGLALDALASRLPPALDDDTITAAAKAVGVAVNVGGSVRWIETERVASVADDISAMLEVFHREHPLLAGPSPAHFEGQIRGKRGQLSTAAIALLEEGGKVRRDGSVISLAGFTPDKSVLDRVHHLYAKGDLAPPSDDTVLAAAALSPPAFADAMSELKRQDRLVRLGDLHFDIGALIKVATNVVRHFNAAPTLSTGELKELAGGISRKFAIPLLEWLDKEGVTVRRDDTREAGSKVGDARFAPK